VDPRVAPFARLYELNTSLLLNCVDHYHIGQLAFLRRQFGHPAMSYPRRDAGSA
jgi:hypothetical protein